YRGREAISQPFDFDVDVLSEVELEPSAVVGTSAELVFAADGADLRVLRGVISECSDVQTDETSLMRYRLKLVPRLWLSSLVQLIDIYMDMTVGELIAHKLDALGFEPGADFELRLSSDYLEREFVVQYEETDLAFLMRQTEHFG